jgi:uncharacterized protein YndB with AHSA1/START domain
MRLGPWFLVSTRLEEMARFYREVVGLTPTREDPGHHVWFSLGGIDLAVHAPDGEVGPNFTPHERGILMWFEAARSLDEVAHELRRRGTESWGPFDGVARQLLLTLDPDGNMVGLFRPKQRPDATASPNAEIRRSTFIRAPAEVVYDLIATAAGLDRWFTSGATLEPRPGGQIVYRWKDWGPDRVTTESHGTVHEARRPSRFVFDWDAGADQQVTVEFDVERAEDGVVLRLREYGYDSTPEATEARVRQASGWGEAMTLIKFMAEHGVRY